MCLSQGVCLQLYHAIFPGSVICVCLLAEGCVKPCLLGWVPSPYGQCINLDWSALCIGHWVLLILFWIICYFGFWSVKWQNHGCIVDLSSAWGFRSSESLRVQKGQTPGYECSDCFGHSLAFSSLCNEACSVNLFTSVRLFISRYSSQHLKWFKPIIKVVLKLLNNPYSCLIGQFWKNFFSPLQMLSTVYITS